MDAINAYMEAYLPCLIQSGTGSRLNLLLRLLGDRQYTSDCTKSPVFLKFSQGRTLGLPTRRGEKSVISQLAPLPLPNSHA